MQPILFIGIGGSGMRGLAYLLEQQGNCIIGYDDAPGLTRCTLAEATDAMHTAQYVVYTDAAPKDHVLRAAARAHKIPEYGYHEALGKFSQRYATLAVTGTHGKSSTTAFLAHILISAGLDPTVLLGASMPSLAGKHAQLGKGAYFIVEADEYRNHFYELHPSEIIITSIDYDHPDAFSSLQDVEKSYEHFMQQLQSKGAVFVPEIEYRAHQTIAWPESTHPIPADQAADVAVLIPGAHMRTNASLAVALAEKIGVPRAQAVSSLKTFPGLGRRFEYIGDIGNTVIRSDYGHHPAEIRATLQGAREFAPETRIIAIFEAHMPQRLHAFFDDFASALAQADEVIITKPFTPAGRDEQTLRDAYRLAEAISQQNTPAVCQFDDNELSGLLANKQPSIGILFSAGTLDERMRAIVKQS
ncbi:MAG: hypothetical protein A3E36_03345 [Candidatus Andersenbacteria bacterium RIFCSPHIGHO2_12_FULL_45_11b]|uniref:UDP-N-acetylmuramate--L-alanine ligase n=1 Tax=Candidatus Andersenbacteria bacterium RIFCSPHIGHO2_12_FULL_45_11b TaxID=1797282 RepID=A0A1G1X9B7_9BACT|nr:MAG: hypothetical protein A3E36_03345 [Candidatus Andersenbacteria bacterium RIFCSPHIGHO2_12_FULL_45_11b]